MSNGEITRESLEADILELKWKQWEGVDTSDLDKCVVCRIPIEEHSGHHGYGGPYCDDCGMELYFDTRSVLEEWGVARPGLDRPECMVEPPGVWVSPHFWYSFDPCLVGILRSMEERESAANA